MFAIKRHATDSTQEANPSACKSHKQQKCSCAKCSKEKANNVWSKMIMRSKDASNKPVEQHTGLKLSNPNDSAEKEADVVADKIVNGENLSKKSNPKKSNTSSNSTVPSSMVPSGGRAMDSKVLNKMSSQFGHNFDDVAVHTNSDAGQYAKAISASAYTVGNHIVFADEQYQPNTIAGQRLLAHELAHVVQNNQENHTEIHRQHDPEDDNVIQLDDVVIGPEDENVIQLDDVVIGPEDENVIQLDDVIIGPEETQQSGTITLEEQQIVGDLGPYNSCVAEVEAQYQRCTDTASTYCASIQGMAGIAGGLIGAALGPFGAAAGAGIGVWATADCGERANRVCRHKRNVGIRNCESHLG